MLYSCIFRVFRLLKSPSVILQGMSSYNIGSPLPLLFEGLSTNYNRVCFKYYVIFIKQMAVVKFLECSHTSDSSHLEFLTIAPRNIAKLSITTRDVLIEKPVHLSSNWCSFPHWLCYALKPDWLKLTILNIFSKECRGLWIPANMKWESHHQDLLRYWLFSHIFSNHLSQACQVRSC